MKLNEDDRKIRRTTCFKKRQWLLNDISSKTPYSKKKKKLASSIWNMRTIFRKEKENHFWFWVRTEKWQYLVEKTTCVTFTRGGSHMGYSHRQFFTFSFFPRNKHIEYSVSVTSFLILLLLLLLLNQCEGVDGC